MRGHDLTGQVFGRLTAATRADARVNGSVAWWCDCVCGNRAMVGAADLRYGKTKSCGCLHREIASLRAHQLGRANARHGHKRDGKESRTYASWRAMLKRTADLTNKYYGGAGVIVCPRWRESFDAFLADMGERPRGKTLDRYPNPAGNYEPTNCRWATGVEQRANRRGS